MPPIPGFSRGSPAGTRGYASSCLDNPLVHSIAQKEKRSHLLEINSFIQGGQFQIDWLYSARFHTEATIQHLVTEFMMTLRSLIAHCQSDKADDYIPSDFPDVELSQEQLELLIAQVRIDEMA